MLPDPVHPAVVHFPIVLMFLLPLSMLAAIWMIHRGARASRAWLVPVVFAAALVASAWVSLETGEEQEERVERVVPELPLDGHKELAQLFLVMAAGVLIVAVAGFVPRRLGTSFRWIAVLGACSVAAAGVRVGHSGGMLVYQHGAASAFAPPGSGGGTTVPTRRQSDDDRRP